MNAEQLRYLLYRVGAMDFDVAVVGVTPLALRFWLIARPPRPARVGRFVSERMAQAILPGLSP